MSSAWPTACSPNTGTFCRTKQPRPSRKVVCRCSGPSFTALARMSRGQLHMTRTDWSTELKFVVTTTLENIKRSVAFYRDVLGATVIREGAPTFLRLGNIWLTINSGGGPTDDKPEVYSSPSRDRNIL